MGRLHGRHLLAKLSATVTLDSHVRVLALATLGDATQIGSYLLLLLHPRWPRKYNCVTVVCHCLQRCCITFANVNMAFKIVIDVSMTVYDYKHITIVTIQIDAPNCGITFIKL